MDKEAFVSKTPVLTPSAAGNSGTYRGWFEVVKQYTAQFDPRLVEAAICGIGGFIVGYLLKNFGRLALLGVVGLTVLLFALHYMQLYTVNVSAIKSAFGLQAINSINDLISMKINFIQAHPIATIAGLLGITLGWKVG